MKIGEREAQEIIQAYQNLEKMTNIACRYGVTRGRVWQILKAAGVDTSKQRINVSCRVCGVIMARTKSHVRKNRHHYCTVECYYASIENQQGPLWRHGQRMARAAVAKVFNLMPEHVVHHVDGSNYNNELTNLVVFACQGDHIRFHRGIDVAPIWHYSSNLD